MNNSFEDAKETGSGRRHNSHYSDDELHQELRKLVVHRDDAQLVKVLNDLQTSIVDLNATVQHLKSSNANTDDKDDSNDNKDEEHLLERATVRLDGLEVYAVVSALTSATLYQGFDGFQPHSWDEMTLIALIGDFFFFLSSSLGVVAGLHATLVFSLITVYGRTAIGMGRDDALGSFMSSTGMVRYRGFQSFLCSIYAFLVQVVIIITAKAPDKTRLLCFWGVLYSMYVVVKDTKAILASASVIFQPPVTTTTTTKKEAKKNQ